MWIVYALWISFIKDMADVKYETNQMTFPNGAACCVAMIDYYK